MKPGIILSSFSAIAFFFTVCALVGASLSLRADTSRPGAGVLPGTGDDRQVSGEHVSQKGDRLVRKGEYTKFESEPQPDLMVDGVAVGDLLNIRVRPSPGANVVARLDNGAVVKKLGCQEVAGHQWCLVELADGGGRKGWAAARYLTGD
jgi:hypothetical protein